MKLSNKLFTVTTLVVVLAVVITAIFTVNAMYRTYENSIQKDLLMTLQLIDSYEGDLSSLDFGSRRFTKISDDGNVIFDSEADKDVMENHLMRPEVQEALSRMTGFAVRESSTMLENMFYVAILSSDGNVIRLSESQSSIYSFIFTSIPYVTAIILLVRRMGSNDPLPAEFFGGLVQLHIMPSLRQRCRTFHAGQAASGDKKAASSDRLLTTREAAQLLNVSTRTLQRMRSEQRIVYVVLRGKCRYRQSEIDRLLDECTVNEDAATPQELKRNHTLRTGGTPKGRRT